eukprot:13309195-Alexandrium_andersonii.AAC.1
MGGAPPRCVATGERLPAPWMLQVLVEARGPWRPWQPLPAHLEALLSAEAALGDWQRGHLISTARIYHFAGLLVWILARSDARTYLVPLLGRRGIPWRPFRVAGQALVA